MSSKPIDSSSENDDLVLQKYKQIYSRYLKDGIIDIDKRMKHKFDYQIYTLEEAIPQVNHVVPPSRQTPYWIVLVKKGTGDKYIGSYSFPVKKNTLYIVPKRVLHSSNNWSADIAGYILVFNVDFFLNNAFPKQHIINRKVLKNSIRPYLFLNDIQMQSVSAIFDSIMQERTLKKAEKDEMIAIKILELLINCDRLFTEAEQIGNEVVFHPVIEQFNNLLEANFTNEKTVSFYADALNIHPNNLNFLTKKHTGISAKQSINNRIITEAKYLLAHSDMNIKSMSHHLGFNESHNFSTFFQRYAGTTPMAFKNTVT